MARIKTIFSYYGGKAAIADKYPVPEYPVIVEPFAGSAAYSQLHWYNQVYLFDANPYVIKTWQYLIQATAEDILKLPSVDQDTRIMKLPVSEGARYLIGYSCHPGNDVPTAVPILSAFRDYTGDVWERRKEQIAATVHHFNHWHVRLLRYELLMGVRAHATWFLDPPYQAGGAWYHHGGVDYEQLTRFCQTRNGQVIACENGKASYLPFKPFAKIQGQMQATEEVMYHRSGTDDAVKELHQKVYAKKIRLAR